MKRSLFFLMCALSLVLCACDKPKSTNFPFGGVNPTSVPQQTQAPSGGYWQYVRSTCDDFKPLKPQEIANGQSWGGQILSNSIQATFIFLDVSKTKQFKLVYNYGWQITGKPQGSMDKLYPGSNVEVTLSLSYTGVDPNVIGNRAIIYTGAFKNYPKDNNLTFHGGGVGTKIVLIPVPKGISAGDESSVDIVCEGGYNSFTYRLFYKWVP